MTKISIIGAGGHTRSSVNILKSHFPNVKYEIFDDSFVADNYEHIAGIPVVGTIKDIDPDASVFLSIGDNLKRKELFKQFEKQLIKQSVFHKTATIEDNIVIGDANQLFANSYINSDTIIGDNNIINTSSIIEHEVRIGNHNHISVGTKICGRVTIGSNCMIGAGAIIIDKVSICDDVVIGAGTVVIKDIKEPGTYVGNPAKRIK